MTMLRWKCSLATLAVFLATGCQPKRSDPVERDARQAGREIGRAVRKVGNTAGAAVDGVKQGFREEARKAGSADP